MKRVLIIEDHNAFRESLASFLDRQPDLKVVAQADSLAQLGNIHLDGIDVALVKDFLADGEGSDLVRQMSEYNPHASALMLTSDLNPTMHSRALAAGALGVLTTAADLQEIVDAIRGFGGN
jgi:two-component system, NarL family, response regulator DevR